MFVLFTLPADFVVSTTAYIGTLFTDLLPVIVLGLGLPLAVWVIRVAGSFIPKGGVRRR